jgi:hypothetical protein
MESTNASKIMKQSAVEWLVEQLCIEGRKTLINQAKSIEKQRIFDAQVDILSEQIVKEKERSYSEEEVLNLLTHFAVEIQRQNKRGQYPIQIKGWFERNKDKFKNK